MSKQPLDYQTYLEVNDRRRRITLAVTCFVIGIVIAPATIFLAVASGGAGHGGYGFARLFFPYSMLLTLMANDRITNPLIAIAWAQFPVYGLLFAVAALNSMKTFRIVSIVIGIVHLIAVIICSQARSRIFRKFSGTVRESKRRVFCPERLRLFNPGYSSFQQMRAVRHRAAGAHGRGDQHSCSSHISAATSSPKSRNDWQRPTM
jgi:hypothetical protein